MADRQVQPSTQFRRKYLEAELLEVSAVSIPANPNALALALKSGAVSVSDLRDTLDLLHSTVAIAPIENRKSKIQNSGPVPPPASTRPPVSAPLLALARLVNSIMRHA